MLYQTDVRAETVEGFLGHSTGCLKRVVRIHRRVPTRSASPRPRRLPTALAPQPT
jgi:hypothetical protein